MDKRLFVLDFIKQQGLAVLSTVDKDGSPQAAVIGFGETNNFEIIFGTDNSSRKYANIQNNPKVAFVIGWDENNTVQFEGLAEELLSKDIQLVRDNYWSKSPMAEKYHANEGQRYFIVKPKWIRYTNLNIEPWEVIEITF